MVFTAVPVQRIALAFYDAVLSGNALSMTASIFLLDALILAIACLNYANLAVAIATTRGKEIGMRKILGASRFHLMRQYLVEAALLAGAAIVIVLAGTALAIEPFNRAFDTNLHLASLLEPTLWVLVAVLIGAISLIGGAYPALVLSRVRPVESLRAGIGARRSPVRADGARRNSVRRCELPAGGGAPDDGPEPPDAAARRAGGPGSGGRHQQRHA